MAYILCYNALLREGKNKIMTHQEMITEAKECFKNAKSFVFPKTKNIDEMNAVLDELKKEHDIGVTTEASLVLVWED